MPEERLRVSPIENGRYKNKDESRWSWIRQMNPFKMNRPIISIGPYDGITQTLMDHLQEQYRDLDLDRYKSIYIGSPLYTAVV